MRVPADGSPTAGSVNNVSVALQYLEAWLGGSGAVGINNLMEDTATAEIARAQLWQWIRHAVKTDSGRTVTLEWVRTVLAEELAALERSAPAGHRLPRRGRPVGPAGHRARSSRSS